MSLIPENLLYTDQHEWLRHEGGVATVGITDYAQHELGDIVFVELPRVGARVSQGTPFGTVEAVKTVADLFAPVSGEIVDVNASLAEGAEQVNRDPYDAGWMIRIKLEHLEELGNLKSARAYEEMLKGL